MLWCLSVRCVVGDMTLLLEKFRIIDCLGSLIDYVSFEAITCRYTSM
jgi:hypothetical protein